MITLRPGSVAESYRYSSVAVGGTFDHIHKGHEKLLERAFQVGKKVYIGLTSDNFAAQEGKKIDQSFETRKKQLENFIEGKFPKREYEITKLERQFGPGMYTGQIGAIVVSSETVGRVESANKKRRELGLPDLNTEVVSMVAADDGSRISSTRIRAGEIDSEGRVIKVRGENQSC
jgi:cytidyltransferase-like protein